MNSFRNLDAYVYAKDIVSLVVKRNSLNTKQ